MKIDVDYNEESFKIDGETVKGISRRTDFDGTLVKSLTNHWSAGLMTEIASSTYSNKDCHRIVVKNRKIYILV